MDPIPQGCGLYRAGSPGAGSRGGGSPGAGSTEAGSPGAGSRGAGSTAAGKTRGGAGRGAICRPERGKGAGDTMTSDPGVPTGEEAFPLTPRSRGPGQFRRPGWRLEIKPRSPAAQGRAGPLRSLLTGAGGAGERSVRQRDPTSRKRVRRGPAPGLSLRQAEPPESPRARPRPRAPRPSVA